MDLNPRLEGEIRRGETSLSSCDVLSKEQLLKLAEESSVRLGERLDRLGLNLEEPYQGLSIRFMGQVMQANSVALSNAEELSSLAVDLVSKEFSLKPNELRLVASITSVREMIQGGQRTQLQQIERLDNTGSEGLEYEIQKRRIVNAFIQGSSHHAQNLFYLA